MLAHFAAVALLIKYGCEIKNCVLLELDRTSGYGWGRPCRGWSPNGLHSRAWSSKGGRDSSLYCCLNHWRNQSGRDRTRTFDFATLQSNQILCPSNGRLIEMYMDHDRGSEQNLFESQLGRRNEFALFSCAQVVSGFWTICSGKVCNGAQMWDETHISYLKCFVLILYYWSLPEISALQNFLKIRAVVKSRFDVMTELSLTRFFCKTFNDLILFFQEHCQLTFAAHHRPN